ncbi:MAG: tyrosine-protein phosphatase [Chloroflexi bacterium]|nr:MAG: tyrosine-protein phosphatase [Chloroflexota bacterium]
MDWPDCQNARDLGGLPRSGGVTRSRVLVRSDNIGFLNAAGREAMRSYGLTTVIDLRSDSELNGASDERFLRDPDQKERVAGVTYLHRALVDDASMKKLGEASNMFDRYLVMLNRRQHAFCGIFNSIAEAEGGLLFHCFAGKDRTGLVAAMLLEMADVPPDQIAKDFGETDLQLADQYEKWISEAAPEKRADMRDELRCPPERILGVLDYLHQKWGGVASYLEASGMTAVNIDRARAKLA